MSDFCPSDIEEIGLIGTCTPAFGLAFLRAVAQAPFLTALGRFSLPSRCTLYGRYRRRAALARHRSLTSWSGRIGGLQNRVWAKNPRKRTLSRRHQDNAGIHTLSIRALKDNHSARHPGRLTRATLNPDEALATEFELPDARVAETQAKGETEQ
jgi:hypothetical protein